MLEYWKSAYQKRKERIYLFPCQPIIPVFHYSTIPAGVKGTPEWSAILLGERKGIWETIHLITATGILPRHDIKGYS
jgi:hypothetical protein